jgi:hypothetical protein
LNFAGIAQQNSQEGVSTPQGWNVYTRWFYLHGIIAFYSFTVSVDSEEKVEKPASLSPSIQPIPSSMEGIQD